MSNQATAPIVLTLAADPRLARLVRMTAANAATLSSMSVDRVEDVRMAAEEAFIFACSTISGASLSISFDVDEAHVGMTFDLGERASVEPAADDPAAAYADLILAAVCDSYEKDVSPAALRLDLRADV